MSLPFYLVDVFTETAFGGNPLPVIFGGEDMPTDEMLRLTRWMNHSETTFVVKPTDPKADYRVRIFTPDREMPFAGHPTLGTCFAWLENGGVPAKDGLIIQQCGAGLVEVRQTASGLAFAAPQVIKSGAVDAALIDELASFLNLDPSAIIDAQWVDNGPGWVVLLLESAEAVLAVRPVTSYHRRMDVGVVGPRLAGDTAFEIRAFFSNHNGAIIEDPVCGSLNASTAQWLLATSRAKAPYTVAQGVCVGRKGRVTIEQDATGQVWAGGRVQTVASGELNI
jgi:PhzF family phenazine biosynthesis protein